MDFDFFVDENGVIHYLDEGKEIFCLSEVVDEKKALVLLAMIGEYMHYIDPHIKDELLAFASLNLSVRIDMSGLEYICASAPGTLYAVQQGMERDGKGHLVLINVPDAILESFKKTGINQYLNIE